MEIFQFSFHIFTERERQARDKEEKKAAEG